jgi:hypothetical protein
VGLLWQLKIGLSSGYFGIKYRNIALIGARAALSGRVSISQAIIKVIWISFACGIPRTSTGWKFKQDRRFVWVSIYVVYILNFQSIIIKL